MRMLAAALLCAGTAAFAGTTDTTDHGVVYKSTTTPPGAKPPVNQPDHSAAGGTPTKKQCLDFNHGAEILAHITERYYQSYTPSSPEDNVGLHTSVLYWTSNDAKNASNIILARIKEAPSSEECKAVKEKGAKLAAEYAAEWPVADAALRPCTMYPNSQQEIKACATAVKPLFEKEKKIKEDGGPLQAFMSAVRAHPTCAPFNEDEKLLFERMGKEPLERDARGVQIRIGKMREARQALAKVKDVPVLEPFVSGAKSLLIAGEGGPCPGPAGSGAEHILWCLRDHPENPNEQLFAATAQVAAAANLVNSYKCPDE